MVRNTRSPRSARPRLGLPPPAPTPWAPLGLAVLDRDLLDVEIDAAEGEHRASLSQDTADNRRGAKDFIERAADEWPSLTTGVVCNSEDGNE